MLNPLIKFIILFITLFSLIGCGEVVVSDPSKPSPSENPTNTADQVITEQAEEVLINDQDKNIVLSDIVNIINTMETTSNNAKQLADIINWLENLTNQVNELTNKDFRTLITNTKNLQLFAINNKVFSTDKALSISDDGHIGFINNSLVIVKGDCNSTYIKDSIVLCTENLKVTNLTNDIIISNGTITLTSSGVTSDNEGALLYNKKNLQSTALNNSVVLFSSPIKFTSIVNTDCINTGASNGTTGICNQLTTDNLTEN